jgi:hypothetical protein
MGLADWIKKWFWGRRSAAEFVPFLDVSGRVIQIPSSAVGPGMIPVRLQGSEETVWAMTEHPTASSELRHPPFDEQVRSYIRNIHETFAEHRPLSFDEWEIGFRQDANAWQEIALWSHAAEVYRVFGEKDLSPERRKEVYRVIVSCLAATPDTIWKILELKVLNHRETKRIVRRVYGKYA